MDVSIALANSAPAFMALALESIVQGDIVMGIPRAKAQVIAAQVMPGTAAMVQNGESPSGVTEKMSTPGGRTIGGLLSLEETGVRGNLARSIQEATIVLTSLVKGSKISTAPGEQQRSKARK